MSIKVEIELPAQMLVKTVGGAAVNLDWSKVPAAVVAAIAQGGAKIILNNAFNGGGKDTPDDTKLAQMQKRMDSWYKGEYVVVERESAYGPMREAFVDERRAALGCSVADVEKGIKDTVARVLGADAKATFANFMTSLATEIARQADKKAGAEAIAEVKAKLEAKYARLADEAAKARANVAGKLDLSAISLD